MAREGLTDFALAKELGGVAHTTVGRWLDGAIPRSAQRRALSERFKIEPQFLFGEEYDIQPGTGNIVLQGQYEIPAEKSQMVREDFVPRLPSSLLKKLANIYVDLDAIRDEIMDYLPEQEAEKLEAGSPHDEHPIIKRLRTEAERKAYQQLSREQQEKAAAKGKSQYKGGRS